MRLMVETREGKEVFSDKAARQELRKFLTQASADILLPEKPYTGIFRRRVIDTLKSGGAVWDKPDHNGQRSSASTTIRIQPEIIGIIRADGSYQKAGDDEAR